VIAVRRNPRYSFSANGIEIVMGDWILDRAAGPD
jgi:hypothetical protein